MPRRRTRPSAPRPSRARPIPCRGTSTTSSASSTR
jgi:hypothetical protein